ncbi:transcription initiation protein SPT3 [Kwoniella heveanensis BCC8398]|uniref:Transcription initiation protein SPT3 n=1 Tax=Kwoniella heveanensis BCC8398 TaxID=1296120 RepID=A0A1B9GV84_9TREE|nr:transcription initiation protein SPT3 [Kwoniella heveanensis BCC8398]
MTGQTAASAAAIASRRRSRSPTPEEEDEPESEDEKKKSGGGKKKKAGDKDGKGDYKYTSEISQMMFVFGEVQDPLPETVRLVEDIVRGQIIEIVTRARLLTHLRSSRFLSAEDLIFLIRDDRGKVNRLRTYLSWKDVRKRAKEDEERAGEVDLEVEGADDKATAKGRKTMMKLPWELLTPFSDYLRSLPSKQNRDDEEDEDEDEMQAHQDSMQRLRDADEITKKMTKDEYVHYSDCRQASFTYRKARRFRDFINFSAYLDVRPNDDIIDILGFLAFEMVRSLCVTALDLRERLEMTKPSASLSPAAAAPSVPTLQRRSTLTNTTTISALAASDRSTASPVKRKSVLVNDVSPSKRAKSEFDDSHTDTGSSKKSSQPHQSQPVSLFAPPPSARQPLLPGHILEAFAQIQRTQAASRVGGMRNFRTGLGKARVALV